MSERDIREFGPVSRILAIRLARLGDVVLLLPSLGLLRQAFGARLSLLTGLPCAPLGEMCPWVDDVIGIDRVAWRDGPKQRALAEMSRLVRSLRRERFDLVVDFHGFRETCLIARLSGGRQRVGMKRTGGGYLPFCFNLPPAVQDEDLHITAMFDRLVRQVPGVGNALPPRGRSIDLPAVLTQEGLMVMNVGASAVSHRWPVARFAEVARYVADRWAFDVEVLSGVSAEEQQAAEAVALGSARPKRVRELPPLALPELAEKIASASLLVSNDTGPMHLGAAVGVPTLGIFSEGLPRHYSPVGPKDRFVYGEGVTEVSVEQVLGVLEEMREAQF